MVWSPLAKALQSSHWLAWDGRLHLDRAGYDLKRPFAVSKDYGRDRSAFLQAQQNVRQTDLDMTDWTDRFAIGLAAQLHEVKRRDEVAIRRDTLARRFGLTGRQAIALGHILEHASLRLTNFKNLA